MGEVLFFPASKKKLIEKKKVGNVFVHNLRRVVLNFGIMSR